MDNYTLFESYLSNKLSKKDRLGFENNMKNDVVLKDAFQEYIVTQTSLDLLLEEDVKSVIADIELEKGAKREGNKMRLATIGAAVALALALVYFMNNNNFGNAGSEVLIAEYYKAPLNNTTRSGNDPVASSMTIAITKAHVLFQAKEYSKAALKFEEILGKAVGPEKERAEWYLALSSLDANPQKAKSLLEGIAKLPNHRKQVEAARLLADSRF